MGVAHRSSTIMDDLGGDDNTFLPDDVREMIREVCDSVLKPETMFKQSSVDEWTAAVVEEILKRLADQRKPFKYVVTCTITQRAGVGMHVAVSTHWIPITTTMRHADGRANICMRSLGCMVQPSDRGSQR